MGFSRQEYWSGVPSPAKAFCKGLFFLEVKHEKYLSHGPAQRVSTQQTHECVHASTPPSSVPFPGPGVRPLTGRFGRESLDSQKRSLVLHQLQQPWLRPPQVVLDPGAEGRAEENRIPRHSKTNARENGTHGLTYKAETESQTSETKLWPPGCEEGDREIGRLGLTYTHH